ncbi:MAG: tetratricopeptide repeat protein [Cyanobacteria bacterium SZAS LIN-3]|nr:tetratricopeptide repeat protein [Cyanobacteria bacterium SZAS LIN-3]
MKAFIVRHNFEIRAFLYLILYAAIFHAFGVFTAPWPPDWQQRLLAVLLVLALLPVCFLPEFRSFCNFCTNVNRSDEDKTVVACNFLIGMTGAIPLELRARAFLRLKRYEEAMADADIAVKLFPGDWYAFFVRSSIADEQDDYDLALGDLNRAVELAPNNTTALTRRAYVRLCRYEPQACLDDCARIETLDKCDEYVRHLKIRSYLLAGDLDAAEAIVKTIGKKIKPESVDAYSQVCFLYEQNKFDEVVSICAKVPDNKFFSFWFLSDQADAYRHLNEGARAMKLLQRALALKPDSPVALSSLAYVLAEAGLLDQALVLSQRMYASGGRWSLRSTEAYVRFRRGEFEDMLECTRHGLALCPALAYSRALHSLALAGMGRVEEALEEAGKATQAHPWKVLAWYALANAQLKQNQFELAIESLDTGLEADPHDRHVYQLRAEAHRLAGNEEQAVRDQAKFDQLHAQYMADFNYVEAV